eukprot:TRINITY_DN109708_c0_g1_i1.p1 TRINITY_DN109708_c0_g1~~TRINITY_DN109708_c0_g1_i1.p1  ORF type:complete len:272 (+),score=35.97 TRINITY_DN109708_c0_g1_i1:59-817(+)
MEDWTTVFTRTKQRKSPADAHWNCGDRSSYVRNDISVSCCPDYWFDLEPGLHGPGSLEEAFAKCRGFAMRRGHRGRVVHSSEGHSPEAMPGRSSFKRRAGGHRDVLRCSMCKPGRHHGAGGAKALKKVKGSQTRQRWLTLLDELHHLDHHESLLDVPLQGPIRSSGQRKPLVLVSEHWLPVSFPDSPQALPAFAQKCKCRACPQKKRRWRFSLSENAASSESRHAEDYETVLADLPNDVGWQLVVGEGWVLV